MNIYTHFLFIISLGTTCFYSTSSMIELDNLMKFSNLPNQFISNSIEYQEELKDNSTYFYSKNDFTLKQETNVVVSKMDAEKIQKEKQQIHQESREDTNCFEKINQLKVIIIICIIIVLLIGSLLINIQLKNRKRYFLIKETEVTREKEIKSLKEELYTKNKDLTDFGLDIARKNEF